MKKYISLFSIVCGICFTTSTFAQDPAILRYEQAKLPLAYEGEVGTLLQQLAQRLNVGFISYELETRQKISVQNAQNSTIKSLLLQLEEQLTNSHIRFEKIGERLFLVASDKNSSPLLPKTAIAPTQFIGDVVFDDAPSVPEKPTAVVPTHSEDLATQKLKNLVAELTDKNKIAQHKGKKAPQYKVSSKERLGLENIRVTPLGTFLIFEKSINTADLSVKGKFEHLIQQDNVIVISHQKQNAPSQIDIKDRKGKALMLKNTLSK